MSFPAYSAYKDSGVDWLGLVPDHWAVTLLKRGYEVVLGKMLQPEARRDDDEFLPYLRAANIQLSGVDTADVKHMWFGAQERNSLLLRRGDLLVSEGGDVGRSAIWEFDGEECYFQNSINRIRSIDGNNTRFLYYWMIAIKRNGYVDMLCNKSTIAHFTAEKVAAVPLSIPARSEQAQIACFLDHETARMDALIEEQQRLIELLKEKRQAVISHAVTKGLDPTVPMKDSGVEWLGEVPAHWKVSRLKFVSTIIDCKNRTPEYVDDGEYLVVRTSNVKNQALSLDGGLYTNEANFKIWTQRGVPPAGSILFTREAPAGEVCLVPEVVPLCLGQRMMNIIPHDLGCTAFLFDFFTSDCLARYIESVAHGSTVSHLRVEQIYDIPVAIPPLSEQMQIDELVSELKRKYSGLISEANQAVALLHERRSALISAAVTGKIDVRDWQPPVSVQAPTLEVEAV